VREADAIIEKTNNAHASTGLSTRNGSVGGKKKGPASPPQLGCPEPPDSWLTSTSAQTISVRAQRMLDVRSFANEESNSTRRDAANETAPFNRATMRRTRKRVHSG
jgi:hypothetical protein